MIIGENHMMTQNINDELDRLMVDPVKNHQKIMERLQPVLPSVIHKDYVGRQPAFDDDNDNANAIAPIGIVGDDAVDHAQQRADLTLKNGDLLGEWSHSIGHHARKLSAHVSA